MADLRGNVCHASADSLVDFRDKERTNCGVILFSKAALLYVGLMGRYEKAAFSRRALRKGRS